MEALSPISMAFPQNIFLLWVRLFRGLQFSLSFYCHGGSFGGRCSEDCMVEGNERGRVESDALEEIYPLGPIKKEE